MFKKAYGNVVIEVMNGVAKRGTCLSATQGNERPIYMDFCGFAIPDGSNAYMYGNKLIIVTRWGGMSEDEINATANDNIYLAVAPFRFIQMGMSVGNFGWSDVFFTLYHCGLFANDETKPIDEIILIFADKSSGEIVADRSIKLPESLGNFFRHAMINSHKALPLDFSLGEFAAQAETDSQRDLCDIVYDYIWSQSRNDNAKFRKFPNLSKIPLGIYIVVNKNGEIINLYQEQE